MPIAPKPLKRTPLKHLKPSGVRRFFFKLELLNKCHPELPYDYSNLDPVVDTPREEKVYRDPSSHGKENRVPLRWSVPVPVPAPAPPIRRASWPDTERVALINEDYAEDALVITTLDTVPFCCHEDLITMSRDQLIGVALALNARLPSALAIDTNRALTTRCIRSAVERIVGLRPDVPPAPKAPRLLTDSESDRRMLASLPQMDRSPPTSPLASRSQSYVHLGSLISPGLERLEEEEEEEEDLIDVDFGHEADRHSKKRKIIFDDTGGDSDSDIDMSPEQTPTPLPRIQRARSHFLNAVKTSPTPVRILRSHNQNIDRSSAIDTSFMYEGRPPVRYQSKAKSERVARTEQESMDLKPIGAPRRSGRLRPIHRVSHAETAVSTELGAGSLAVIGEKRKRISGSAEAARQVTSGFNRMSMCSENSRSGGVGDR
ncbi:hypothetical protein DXG01_011402 [Tephrocybe rancida]|nr:hypothetical protein DXG01_011402 [Tephrocybe rancida]